MKEENQVNDLASTMFRKGSNAVDLVFGHQFGILPMQEAEITKTHFELLDAMLYCYLLGACSCINDNASFIELSEAIDMVYNKETENQ